MPDAGKGMEKTMHERGLKMTEFVAQFGLEVLHKGADFDTTLLTITDVNRPGLQFHDFYDYFDPRRLQVVGKAEIMYLKGLTEQRRRKCFCLLYTSYNGREVKTVKSVVAK